MSGWLRHAHRPDGLFGHHPQASVGGWQQSSGTSGQAAAGQVGLAPHRDALAGGGRMSITNDAIKVFDESDVLRVQMGDLTA